jgi:hypothetical protein
MADALYLRSDMKIISRDLFVKIIFKKDQNKKLHQIKLGLITVLGLPWETFFITIEKIKRC